MKVVEHKHPLKLIDLHLENANQEEEYDEEDDDLITREEFRCTCYRCGQEINIYHRYYYKCTIDSSCDFSLHNFCTELPTTLKYPSHRHPLILVLGYRNQIIKQRCTICQSPCKPLETQYGWSYCHFHVDLNCAVEVQKKIIYHPSHQHPLMCAVSKPILCDCSACGKEHKGMFYHCTICVGFTIHNDCAFLPKSLLIQERTDGDFYHTHPLSISYSFLREDQIAKHYPRCRVCTKHFFEKESLWIYKCDKCLYYAHVDCATSRGEPFTSFLLPAGSGKLIKIFEDVDHPHLLHLPFPDETYSLPRHLYFKESGTFRIDKVNLQHISHQHPLILVDHTQCDENNSSRINPLLCHNPMKKTQLQCDGCLRPIMSTMPFYKCVERCNFVLHEWCTRLPSKIENHPGHSQHTLVLMSNILEMFFGVFHCAVCRLLAMDLPIVVPNHLLSIVQKRIFRVTCHICHLPLIWDPFTLPIPIPVSFQEDQLYFSCNICDIYIHPECALLFSATIRHKYDKHLMHLSYLPIENHKSEYFCEICEFYLNPHESFYHCRECVQSIHTACAPLILRFETNTYIWNERSTYYYVNIKFGGYYNSDVHPHPPLFAQGTFVRWSM